MTKNYCDGKNSHWNSAVTIPEYPQTIFCIRIFIKPFSMNLLYCVSYFLTCQRVLRAYILTCQRALRAFVIKLQRALRAGVLTCQQVL